MAIVSLEPRSLLDRANNRDGAPAAAAPQPRRRATMELPRTTSGGGGGGGGGGIRRLFPRRRSGGGGGTTLRLKRDKAALALASLALSAFLLCFDMFGYGTAPLDVKQWNKLKTARAVAGGGPPPGRGSTHWASSSRRNEEGRNLQSAEPWCYTENMIGNANFDSGRALWTHHGTASFTTEWVDVEGTTSRVAVIQDRGDVYHGIKTDIAPAIPCMTGTDFFLHISMKVKMYDKATGAGIHSCMNGEALVANEWNKNHCPFVRMHGWKNNDTATYANFDAYDTVHTWDGDSWNDIDFITDVVPALQGDDLTKLVFSVRGGPADAVVLVDDIVVRRVDAPDIPVDSPIYDPDAHQDCATNMIKNGGAEYQSPIEWDVHRWWNSNRGAIVDNVDLGNGEHAFLLTGRDNWRQGMGQDIDPYFCLKEPNLYVRISFDVMIYNEWFGTPYKEGSNAVCKPTWPEYKNCPQIKIWYTNPGVSWNAFTYRDSAMELNWDHAGWNKYDVIVAMNPGVTTPDWTFTRLSTEGGPEWGAVMIDNLVMRQIPYEEIPAGKAILDWDGVGKTNAIMECHSVGDPHMMAFSGTKFDDHTEGWQPLYVQRDLRVEAYQKTHENRLSWSINTAVRVTYGGTVYEFADGAPLPPDDQYLTHKSTMEEFVFPDPDAKVYIQFADVNGDGMKEKLGSKWYQVYIYTKDIFGAGICCDVEPDLTVQPREDMAIEFPEDAPSIEAAELACTDLEDQPEVYQNCITDYRVVTTVTNDTDAARSLVVETVSVQVAEAEQVQHQAVQFDAYSDLREGADMYEDAANAGAQGDPTIVGIKNQAFKFDGRSDAWYANLASESLQWNMKFHQFEGCTEGAGMFVTGVTIGLRERHRITNSVVIRVRDEDSFFPDCDLDDDDDDDEEEGGSGGGATCLGAGSLEIVLDGETITKPGDYFTSGPSSKQSIRVVAYNTYEACSRKWYDYDGPRTTGADDDDNNGAVGSVESDSRALSHSKLPLDFLADSLRTAIRPEVCADWMHERTTHDDLFRQKGSWTTVHVETPLVSFHVEYRQNAATRGDRSTCFSHSIDAWMAETSPRLKGETWRGILGETRYRESGESDRGEILIGKEDKDYEVSGPYGTNFGALGMSHWFWPLRGALRGVI